MYQKNITTLIQSLLLATVLASDLIASACSAESSSIPVLSNQSPPPTEIYELGLAYYEGNSVPEDDDKAFELFQKAADQGYAPAKHYLGIMKVWA